MRTKTGIVADCLPRGTAVPLEKFAKRIPLTNFSHDVELFAEWHKVAARCKNRSMSNATADGIAIASFGMGNADPATVTDLLAASDQKGTREFVEAHLRSGIESLRAIDQRRGNGRTPALWEELIQPRQAYGLPNGMPRRTLYEPRSAAQKQPAAISTETVTMSMASD